MSPLGSSEASRKPALKKVEKGRALVPAECVPAWAKGQHPESLRMIPLHWRRSLEPLPQSQWLDCWYLWNPGIPVNSWEFDPQLILAGKISDENERFRLELLVFDAEFDTQTKSHRIHCHNLLHSLALKGVGGVWILPEQDGSISVWADPAFQLYHARVE